MLIDEGYKVLAEPEEAPEELFVVQKDEGLLSEEPAQGASHNKRGEDIEAHSE